MCDSNPAAHVHMHSLIRDVAFRGDFSSISTIATEIAELRPLRLHVVGDQYFLASRHFFFRNAWAVLFVRYQEYFRRYGSLLKNLKANLK